MSIEKYIKQSREELRRKFGEVGVKKDCKHYKEDLLKQSDCHICLKTKDTNRMQCEIGVCYFYDPK